jgi:aminopeptidase YwaD
MNQLAAKASSYLRYLCLDLPGREVGSAGNQAATDFFARTAADLGWAVETPRFECLAWTAQGARLSAAGETFVASVSPYSPGGQVTGPLQVVESIEALEALGAGGAAGRILLLRGEIAREQLMPKNFPFYSPDEHQRVYRALEASGAPAAIAATTRNPGLAGALYPFPLIEDGDFDVPSVYMTEEEGARLRALAGRPVTLEVRAERHAGQGCNVVARRGGPGPAEVVVMAHIDAKAGTPGALDNAAGVTVLLLLAELLRDEPEGGPRVELVAMNGEDYYSAPGEQLYLRQNKAALAQMQLGINLDGLGYREGRTAYSLYNCPAPLAATIHATLAAFPGLAEGEPWFQGDHMLYLLHERPALAFTSERVVEMMAQIVHTAADRPELVRVEKLVEAAEALRALVGGLR